MKRTPEKGFWSHLWLRRLGNIAAITALVGMGFILIAGAWADLKYESEEGDKPGEAAMNMARRDLATYPLGRLLESDRYEQVHLQLEVGRCAEVERRLGDKLNVESLSILWDCHDAADSLGDELGRQHRWIFGMLLLLLSGGLFARRGSRWLALACFLVGGVGCLVMTLNVAALWVCWPALTFAGLTVIAPKDGPDSWDALASATKEEVG